MPPLLAALTAAGALDVLAAVALWLAWAASQGACDLAWPALARRRVRGLAAAAVLAQTGVIALALGVQAAGGADPVLAGLAVGIASGTVGFSAAHELGHRRDRRRRMLGAAFHALVLAPHYPLAHRIHHRLVASAADAATARRGESVWRFAPRAWARAWRQALARRRSAQGPLGLGVAVSAGALALAAACGPGALAVFLIQAAVAQALFLVTEYMQHYGLTRARGADGRLEPVGPRHAWTTTHAFNAALCDLGRHAEHHAGRAGGPALPASYLTLFVPALLPRLWFRLIDPRLEPAPGPRNTRPRSRVRA